MDDQGTVVASASADHEPFASPRPGWAEQDPRDWWQACGTAVRKALQSSNVRADNIACVGFSGQMHGAVLLDSADEVVRSAIIWCDQRSEAQSNELSAMFGRDVLIRLTCNPPLTNFTLTKLLWVREIEPKNWERVAHVMLPKDYVRFRLTGDRAIDMADASGTLLLDVANRRWSEEVLSKTGIEERMLPALHESPQGLRTSIRRGSRGYRTASRNAGRGRRRRSGGGRRWHGHCARRRSQRHDRNFRGGFCRNGSTGARSAGAVAHVLSRDPWTVACDGRDPGRGIVVALVS